MRPVGSASELEIRRKDAVRRMRAGERPVDIARELGVSTTAVHNWKRAAAEGGLRALNAVPQHVPTCRLSDQQKRSLRTILRRGALAHGFPTDLWTCDRIAEVIFKQFGIHYDSGHLSRLLRALGYTPQKPKTEARERDPQAAEHFRRVTWPAVKKGAKTQC